MKKLKKILVTGGGGYVGSVLCPKLLKQGYDVKVIDLMIYDPHSLDQCKNNPKFQLIKKDIRDKKAVEKAIKGIECIIHLAAISNDPTCELDEKLTKSINYDAYKLLLGLAKRHEVKRFINASSSSVFGIKKEKNITEDIPCNPLTLYSKYKLKSEELVKRAGDKNFTVVNIRPATICGYSPRMRLDLTVNILTYHAISKGVITVHGGEQRRPHITITDITDIYINLINEKKDLISKETFNAGFENMKMIHTANLIKDILKPKNIDIKIVQSFDLRDYHISSEKIKKQLNFKPKFTVKYMILDLAKRFAAGDIPNPEDDKYYNTRKMKLEYFK